MATVFAGGTYVNFSQFAGTFKCLIMQGIMNNLVTAGWSKQTMNVGNSPGSYGLATQGPGNVGTVTMPIATPGVVNFSGHGFLGGEKVMFQAGTGGTLPTGATAGTVYYVRYVDTNSFQINTAYSGGTNQNFTGSSSGTLYCYSQYILMVSGTQSNVTNPITIRIQDNSGSCVAITCQHYDGTFFAGNGSRYNGAQIIPVASPNIQITATKYWFYVGQVGAVASRDYCLAGMLYIPSFLSGINDHGFVLANAWDGETSGQGNSFRTTINIGTTNLSNSQFIWNGGLVENSNNSGSTNISYPAVLVMQNSNWYTSLQGYRWADNSVIASDVLLSAGPGGEGKIRGQFYDMLYIDDAYAIDSTDTFNGHTWLNMTSNQTGVPRGGMWLATS